MPFTLSFTEQELLVLNEALVRMPFGQVAGLISKINEQLSMQRKAGAPSNDEAQSLTVEAGEKQAL